MNRAKRRLMKWQRYVAHTGTLTAHKFSAGHHRGHAKAFADVSYAKRCPHPGKHYGARQVHVPSWVFKQRDRA